MRGYKNFVALAATVAALGFAVGCGGDGDGGSTAAERSFVGAVEGTNAYIALVSDGTRVTGYVCDGTPKKVSVYFWLKATEVNEGSAKLSTRQGLPVGEASLTDSKATGEVQVEGKAHSFSAELAEGEAGLYRAIKGEVGQEGTVEAGWIVANDGSQRGGAGFIDPNLELVPKPAPFIDPVADQFVSVPQAGRMRVTKFIDLAD